jgi:hydroxymethylbilane synthase
VRIRAATRGSALAIWQTTHVSALLTAVDSSVAVEMVVLDTEGDRRRNVPISELGGKGVFAKEVQAAVLDGRADIAVHSAKDLPSVTVDGLVLAGVPERGDPRDALVGSRLADLGTGARIGTGSNRRRVQLAHIRPDLEFAGLRGNMHTRLAKASDFDAIVVAAAALQRLGLADHINEILAPEVMVPQVAQGALGVECRADDAATRDLLSCIEDPGSRMSVDAERAFLAELGGDCDLPAGAHATHVEHGLAIDAILAAPHGPQLVRLSGVGSDPAKLGASAARDIRSALARAMR